MIKEQSGENGKKKSYRKKDKKKFLTESESNETDSDNEGEGTNLDMKELMAIFSRIFRKGKFDKRRFNKNSFNKYEDRKNEKGRSTIIKLKKAKVKCFNSSELGHFGGECMKSRNNGKGKALMITQKDLADQAALKMKLTMTTLH